MGLPVLNWFIAKGPFPKSGSSSQDAWVPTHTTLVYGFQGDTPVVGDWNGDGRDDLGVISRVPADVNGAQLARWYREGAAVVDFGFPTDKPIVGNWDGGAKDQVGVVRNVSGSNSLVLLNTDADTDDERRFLVPDGQQFVAGHWDISAPTATAAASISAYASQGTVTIAYRDDQSIEASQFGTGDIQIVGPGGYSRTATYHSQNSSQSGNAHAVTYLFAAPGGTWNQQDNGTYEVRVNKNQVSDSDGNLMSSQYVGTFLVNITDKTRPSAKLFANNITSEADASFAFTVDYQDNDAVARATIQDRHLVVSSPHGDRMTTTLAALSPSADAPTIRANYRVNPLNGTWDANANGIYTVSTDDSVRDVNGNRIIAGPIGNFQVNIADVSRPSANVSVQNITESGNPAHDIRVTFSDNVMVDASSLDDADLRVIGPNQFNSGVRLISLDGNADAAQRTANYRLAAPGGTWNHDDNGTYEIVAATNQVRDVNGLFARSETIGSFQVNVDVDDFVAPTATLSPVGSPAHSESAFAFSVTYADDLSIRAASLDNFDIRIYGPHGFDSIASLMEAAPNVNSKSIVAKYQVAAPGGSWNSTDNGEYSIRLRPNQVSDLVGNTVEAIELGTFDVQLSDYSIDIVFAEGHFTDTQKWAFEDAAERWSEVIVGDVPDVLVSSRILGRIVEVDDLLIIASAPEIDGPGRILGQATPTQVRQGSYLPVEGLMQFDRADVEDLERRNRFVDVIMHEMAHVLGFGTLWNLKGLVTGQGTGNPRYVGEHATREYNRIFENTETGIPVENTGGRGTREVHWRESVFENEIMTGFLNPCGSNLHG